MSAAVSTFRSKLSRLTSPGHAFADSLADSPRDAAVPVAASSEDEPLRASPSGGPAGAGTERSSILEDVRQRMNAILARTVLPKAPPPVETVELPFLTTETSLGPLHQRRLVLPPSHVMGRFAVQPARDADSALLALLALDPSLSTCDVTRALYLDTETTGLAGGTGTVAFLVGLGGFEADGSFVVEQILVRNLGEEGPMLLRVAERIAASSLLVTYNGKSFDLPLLRTRFVLARLSIGAEPPHLDLVHLARRIHKSRGGAFRLTRIERDVLGFERENDVPSGDVAAHYLHFLRSGDARALLGVIDHNAWDVATMAVLVGLYGEPIEATQLTSDDLAGVALSMKRAGALDRARDVAHLAVERAVERAGERGGGGQDSGLVASLDARARIAKARGDRARALADFEQLAAKIDSAAVRLELAKLYEHFARAPDRALSVTDQGTGEDESRADKRRRRLRAKVDRASLRDRAAAAAGQVSGNVERAGSAARVLLTAAPGTLKLLD